MTCEAVLVMVHSHEIRKDNDEEADYFLEEFAHACIDAGASAVIGGGTHQLKGIELYHDCPIFYCLGNFIFENQYVRLLPADYMEKYGLNIHTAASIGIARRQEQSSHSLYEIPEVYRSVLPYFEICQGKCTHLELLPVELGMDRENAEKKYSVRGRRKNSRKNCRISHPREQEIWNRMGIQRRKDCTSCVKMGNRRGIPKLLPEQQRTCAADAAGADTDPDGNGKRGSENRILHGMDETAGHGVGSYG